MIFTAINEIKAELLKAFKKTYPELGLSISDFKIERPKNLDFGDLSTNISMRLAKKLKQNPISIAEQISNLITNEKWVYSFVKPGFINITFNDNIIFESMLDIIKNEDSIFLFDLGRGEKVQIEFISANPTGPLNVVNARAASIGDVLARLFTRFGFQTEKEYYINDAGNQVKILGHSIELSMKKLNGEEVEFPEDYYAGEYIFEIARELQDGFDSADDAATRSEEIRDLGLNSILQTQRNTIEKFGLIFDNWFSEKSLYLSDKHTEALEILKQKNLIYEKDGATWIKTTELGDAQDWVLIKSDGSYTYLMGDIAYHLNKFERGFTKAINIWGPDHQAGVSRLKAALTAFEIPGDWLEVLIIQQVNLIRNGERVKISKRKGIFETLEKLIEEVGVDAARFTFLLRTTSSHLDFDIDLAKQQVSENPVYYIQYAHARLCSIFRKASESGLEFSLDNIKLEDVINSEARDVIRKVFEYPLILKSALLSREPSRITNYSMELADIFHAFYHNFRIITEDKEKTISRLGICRILQIIFKDILDLIGVSAPEHM